MQHSLPLSTRHRAWPSARRPCGRAAPCLRCAPIGPPLTTARAILRSRRSRARSATHDKKADADALVYLSPDAARFARIPTLRTTLGGKGPRPLVGNVAWHRALSLYGARNLVTGHVPTRLGARPRKRRTATVSKRWDLQAACATHLRAIARAYPAPHSPRGGLVVDNASWQQGQGMDEVLTVLPHLELSPLPRSSPQFQVSERFWQG